MSIQTAPDGFLADSDLDRSLTSSGIAVSNDTFSVIDKHSFFDGTFRSDRDLRIEGEVKGTIECKGTLFVAQGANVTAKVEAENISVAGDLNGEIRSRGRLQITPSGRVRGKVDTKTLVINEGAYYEGQLEMEDPQNRTGGNRPSAGASPLAMSGAGETRRTGPAGNSTTFIRRLGGPETPWDTSTEQEPGDDDGQPERN